MPITKKTIPLENLAKYDVYIEDTSQNSEYFNISKLPSVFTGGRNSFLLDGSYFLKNNTLIKIEILDEAGVPIFQTVVDNYVEGTSTMISVEIYDTVTPGLATITVVGVLDKTSDGNNVPSQWKDVYNVRWSKKILVDYNQKNVSPILFTDIPEVLVEERRFYNVISSSYNTYNTNFTMSLHPIRQSTKQTGYQVVAETPSTFSGEHFDAIITGSLVIANNNAKEIYLPIDSILSSKLAFVEGYFISSSINNGIIKSIQLRSGSYFVDIDGVSYPITTSAKLQYATVTTATTNIPLSYASLRIVKLDTISGEPYKIRAYNKPTSNTGEYRLLGDFYLNTSEILISSSIRGYKSIGNIYETTNYQDNWYAGSLAKNVNVYTPLYIVSGSPLYYNSAVVVDSTQFAISSSNDTLLSAIYAGVPIDVSTNKFAGNVSESGYFIGTKESYTLFDSTEYTLSFDTIYTNASGSISLNGNTSQVDIYVVGSGSNDISNRNPLGQKIGQITTSGINGKFANLEFNFTPMVRGSDKVGLRFVVSNGFWYFSNISLKPASDPRFCPDEVEILLPNTEYYNELLQYKVEFFDINNNSTSLQIISTPTFFTGSTIDLGTLP
jgi:hypothetical protein